MLWCACAQYQYAIGHIHYYDNSFYTANRMYQKMFIKLVSILETFETLPTDLVDCSSLKPSPSPIQFVDLLNGVVDLTPIQRLMWNICRHNLINYCSKPVHQFFVYFYSAAALHEERELERSKIRNKVYDDVINIMKRENCPESILTPHPPPRAIPWPKPNVTNGFHEIVLSIGM